MKFFNRKHLKISDKYTKNDFYSRNYEINIVDAETVSFEVYRETKSENGCDLPITFIGIRIFEDIKLKEDIILHSFENYGLFSYISCYRHKNDMDYAIRTANFIANVVIEGYEIYDYKLKKKFISEQHVYLLEIPLEYEIEMPDPEEHLEKTLDLEIQELNNRKRAEITSNFNSAPKNE